MGALRAAFRVGEQLTTPLARDEAVTQPCAGEGAEVEEDGAFVGGRLALARELETVQIPKFATDEYSCRRVPGVDSSEVR